MKILLAGGGSGGPATPLLAVAEQIRKLEPQAEFLFVGTKNGPEKTLVEESHIPFKAINAAKLRRYFSLRNLLDIFVFAGSLVTAYRIVSNFKPDVIFSVGSFVAVPICWAGKMKKIKIAIHQQDAQVGLANKLTVPMAHLITTAFEETAKEFYSGSGLTKESYSGNKKIEWVGNPVREEFLNPEIKDREFFALSGDLPIILIFGGATGAEQINQAVAESVYELVKSHQVIHITGKGQKSADFKDPNYHPFEFLGSEMADAMKLADIVVCRAGLSTIAELSALRKIAIVIPMPDSHQEANALILKQRTAAVVLDKHEFDPENFIRVVRAVKFNPKRQESLQNNIYNLMPHDAAIKLARLILSLK